MRRILAAIFLLFSSSVYAATPMINCSGSTFLQSTANPPTYLCNTPSGSGTVTSVSAGTLSPLFTTSVSNSTTTPSITFSLDSVNPNLAFMGPASGSAATPTMRALVIKDEPLYTGIAQTDSAINCYGALR